MGWKRQRALIVLILLATSVARAQVFRVQGGQSNLLNAEGGSLEFKAPDYDEPWASASTTGNRSLARVPATSFAVTPSSAVTRTFLSRYLPTSLTQAITSRPGA